MGDATLIRAFLEERHLTLSQAMTPFADSEIRSLSIPPNDPSARTQARQILAALGKAGWLGYILPKEYGGQPSGPDLRACGLIRESLAGASSLADAVFALQCLGSMPITLAGNESLKTRWLSAVAKGEAMAAFAMTEPEAGSDVASMKTTARRHDDTYILDGVKTLISNAGIADFYTVFAVTDPGKGNKGISCFAVPATQQGLRFVKPQVLSSPHPLGEMAFLNCSIPASFRIGEEGEGFKIGMETLDRLRSTVAAAACGMAERALEEAITYAVRRRQFGKSISEFQLVQEKLARMATDLAAARLLVYRALWEKDRGAERITVPSAMAKTFATEAAQRIVDDALQILGGIGVLADHPVERLYRAVRGLRIYEGTTEILNLVIANHLLKEAK